MVTLLWIYGELGINKKISKFFARMVDTSICETVPFINQLNSICVKKLMLNW